MASCDDFDLPNPPGQTNTDPEAYFADADLALAPQSETLSLTEANAANQFVTVANITTLNNFPAGYELAVDMQVGNDATFSKATTVETVISGDAVTVNPDVLNGAIQSVITKKPGTYEVNSRFQAYAVKGNTRIPLGGLNHYYLTEVLQVKTYDAIKVIEDAYYIIPMNADGTPNWNGARLMNNNGGVGVSPYDNPEFSLMIESPAPDGYYLKIAPQSVLTAKDASQLLGVNPAEDGFSGKLGTSYAVGHIAITGDILVTINAELDAITYSYAFSALYPFSGSLKGMKLYTDNYITYSGVCVVNLNLTICTTPDGKSEPIFRQDAEVPPVVSEDGYSQSGGLSTDPTAKQIQAPRKGKHLCWVSVDLPALTYDMTVIENLALIGNHNGWSHETSIDLTASKDFNTWTATDVQLDGGCKIAANKIWGAVDFGGVPSGTDSEGNLVYTLGMKGGDMDIPAGKYDVTINFSAYPYVMTLKKK